MQVLKRSDVTKPEAASYFSNSSSRSFRKSFGVWTASRSSSSMKAGTPEKAVAAWMRSSAGRNEVKQEVIVTTGNPFKSGA